MTLSQLCLDSCKLTPGSDGITLHFCEVPSYVKGNTFIYLWRYSLRYHLSDTESWKIFLAQDALWPILDTSPKETCHLQWVLSFTMWSGNTWLHCCLTDTVDNGIDRYMWLFWRALSKSPLAYASVFSLCNCECKWLHACQW